MNAEKVTVAVSRDLQKSQNSLMTSGVLSTLEFEGFVYWNHSRESSHRFERRASSLGSSLILFSCRFSLRSCVRSPSLLSTFSIRFPSRSRVCRL